MKSLLGKGGKTDFQVRQWGIRRTRTFVVPLNQQPGSPGFVFEWQNKFIDFSHAVNNLQLSHSGIHQDLAIDNDGVQCVHELYE